jgi:hypothetical protein
MAVGPVLMWLQRSSPVSLAESAAMAPRVIFLQLVTLEVVTHAMPWGSRIPQVIFLGGSSGG